MRICVASIKLLDRSFGACNIALLGRLVTATQQNDQYTLTAREIDAIPGTHIDPHFADAVTKRPNVIKISQARRIEPDKDSRFGAHIAQIQQPLLEGVGLLNLVHALLYPYGYDASTPYTVAP
jgi:hypothetical protein